MMNDIKGTLILLGIVLVVFLAIIGSCSNGDSDGGPCKYCGQHTNWNYSGGGYICFSCDH